jgi:hypothetical protein
MDPLEDFISGTEQNQIRIGENEKENRARPR